MKKIIPYALIAFFASFLGVAYTKSENEPPVVEISLMEDITDTFRCHPDSNSIFPLFHFNEHKWNKYRFTSRNISNYDYNPVHSYYLSSSFPLLANPNERDEEISVFKQEILAGIDSINTNNGVLPKSSVYLPLIRELNRMAKSPAKEKIIVVYSDLTENTSIFSLYNRHCNTDRRQDSLLGFFRRIVCPNDLTGVTVYFIFRPRNDAEHDNFNCMANMYKRLLEDAHAHVYIGANIIPQT